MSEQTEAALAHDLVAMTNAYRTLSHQFEEYVNVAPSCADTIATTMTERFEISRDRDHLSVELARAESSRRAWIEEAARLENLLILAGIPTDTDPAALMLPTVPADGHQLSEPLWP